MIEDDKLVRYLLKHVIPIYFRAESPESVRSFVVTTFLLSVDGHWFLVTAGHCLKDINTLQQQHGHVIRECSLVDSLGLQAKHWEPIPFTYAQSSPRYFGDDPNADYGIIPLSSYYQGLLQANAVQPFDEEAWDKQPASFDMHFLLGVPWQLAVVGADAISITPVLIPVERLPEKPPQVPDTELPLFYGSIPVDPDLSDIAGMSGGPILGFRTDPGAVGRYWLVAIQSHWIPSSRTLLACPARVFGRFIRDVVLSQSASSGRLTTR